MANVQKVNSCYNIFVNIKIKHYHSFIMAVLAHNIDWAKDEMISVSGIVWTDSGTQPASYPMAIGALCLKGKVDRILSRPLPPFHVEVKNVSSWCDD